MSERDGVEVVPCPECGGFRFPDGPERHTTWCSKASPTNSVSELSRSEALFRAISFMASLPPSVNPASFGVDLVSDILATDAARGAE